ncbi:MAG: DEAD/DEAH box helicase, partial [Coriobacteriales bacterium]
IVAAGEGWHEGVKGIVASRIARRYKRPTIIFTIQDGVARGSGRSYGGINLFELVSRQADELDAFGGHAAAVGVTIAEDRLKEFSERLSAAVESVLKSGAPEPRRIDTAVDLAECTVEGYDELERLQPFGNDNPTPLLVARNVFLERRSAVGKQGTHFRFDATDGNARVSGIYFSPDNLEELLSCQSACDVVFEPSIDEWQGRRTAKLMCRGIFEHKASVVLQTEISQRVDELFMHSVEISDTGEYAGITQQARFFTKVVGVTFENRQQVLSRLESGVELRLEREPENEVDRNAIAVKTLGGEQLGFLNRHLAARLAPVMDEGAPYDAAVSEVTGGPAEGREDEDTRIPGPLGVRDPGVVDRSYGVNIIVRRGDIEEEPEVDPDEHAAQLAKARAKWAQLDADELDDELREALIGEHSLHNAQKRTLDNLAQGRSTLTIMATGRGKSLIFHLHAARCALKDNNASVFIYPLRALVADQAFHLQETFARFGLSVCVLTGESDEAERSRIFEGLSAGTVDVILTTPEFLSIHAEQFARTGRIGFLVVDEAHHIAQAKAGNRAAYAHLDTTIKALGNPLVLAVTATAGDAATRDICSTLGISELVVDPTVRENLAIDDKRDLRNREGYLAHLIAGGGKTVAYVNSRETSIELTRKLRKRLPELAPRIAFYNAGLTKEDRKNIETAFRDGDLVAIVSTSAFGEGIDIPDIEHVVLFHLPFNDIEFNQMSGRAGRDGRAAQVHLLYSYGDARINESILSASAPSHEQLAALYRVLLDEAKAARERGEEGFSCTNAELAEKAGRAKRSVRLTDSAVSCGVSVFKELGFLDTRGKSVSRRIFMVE